MNTENYLNELKNIFKDRLESVFVYGAKARLPLYELKTDVDLMVIVSDLCAKDLSDCSNATKKWTGTKNPVPVFMSTSEWFGSQDVYPMEYLDIKERHHILWGENLIDSIQINPQDLRLQCELETKNLLMRMRRYFILNTNDKKGLEQMITGALKTAAAVFKTVLRLKQQEVPESKNEIIQKAALICNVDAGLFEEILAFKEKKSKLKDPQKTAAELINETNKLLAFTNNL